MPRLWSQFAAVALVAVYGALALLGHGGMHAVQDAAGVTHSHGGHPIAYGHDPSAEHRCCHGHSHPHDHAAEERTHDPDHDDGHHRHGPHHDPNDCVVCHYFATAAVQQIAAPEIVGTLLASASPLTHAPEPASTNRFVQPIRGPPEPHC